MMYSDRSSACRGVVRTQLLRDSSHSDWRQRHFRERSLARFWDTGWRRRRTPGGLSRTAYPSDSCTVVLIEIAADLESQLEIVSEVPGDSIRFSSEGRLLKALRSWEARLLRESQVKQLSATRGSHSAWSRCRHQSHPSARHANSRGSLCGVPHRQPLDLAEVLAKLATVLDEPRSSQSLEKEFGVDMGRATTETKYTEVLNGGRPRGVGLPRLGGHAPMQRILHTHHECPGVVMVAPGTEVGEDLTVLRKKSGAPRSDGSS